MQTFTTPEHHDKSEWGDGPWQDEPDKIVWVDGVTDLDCMLHRGPLGSWCGYVGVTREHPLYGKEYDDVHVDVHGGELTYAAPCAKDATPEHGVCHVPQDGRSDEVWWFGFDCAHAWDLSPAFRMRERKLAETVPGWPKMPEPDDGLLPRVSYKPVAWVREEVRRLAAQLAALQ